VIDHRRDAGWRAARRMDTDTRGAGIEHAAQPIGTAVVEDAVTSAAQRRPRSRCREFLNDDVDNALQLVSVHESIAGLKACLSSSIRIFANLAM
jgi:hypothetical protein